jgi:tetratricopeptide (TPR) repeat protein
VRAAKAAEPDLPDEITPKDLHPSARNELKTLSKENAESVARHLAMAAQLIDEDPKQAHAHALAASRRAGRIAVVRETVAITAYALGDYALALRELRTYRRISGREDQVALMVDSERGVGRPDRAVELGRSVNRDELPTVARVELAIAMSGARLDLGEPARALSELDIPELDPDRAFEWSPSLFQARATVLEELGRTEEAAEWHRRALVAADAIDDAIGAGTDEEIIVVEEFDDEEDLGQAEVDGLGSDDDVLEDDDLTGGADDGSIAGDGSIADDDSIEAPAVAELAPDDAAAVVPDESAGEQGEDEAQDRA